MATTVSTAIRFPASSPVRAVVEKHAVGPGVSVLDVRFEDLLATGAYQRAKLMCVEGGMTKIHLKESQGLSHLLEETGTMGVGLQLMQGSPGRLSQS